MHIAKTKPTQNYPSYLISSIASSIQLLEYIFLLFLTHLPPKVGGFRVRYFQIQWILMIIINLRPNVTAGKLYNTLMSTKSGVQDEFLSSSDQNDSLSGADLWYTTIISRSLSHFFFGCQIVFEVVPCLSTLIDCAGNFRIWNSQFPIFFIDRMVIFLSLNS